MKTLNFLIVVILGAGFLVSCGEDDRYEANVETTEGIEAMKEHIEEFQNHNGENYQQLAEELEGELHTILDECTMEGEAHEHLHDYLEPLHEKIKALDEESGEEEIAEMRTYLDEYDEHFK